VAGVDAQSDPVGRNTVPVGTEDGWRVLSYRDIPAHDVSFDKGALTISVRRSASPLVYRLPEPVDADTLLVRGRVDGTLDLPADVQGKEGFDDYVLRVGVVLSGSRRPSVLQRLFAPEWLKTLFGLAPDGGGISEVQFFNVASDAAHIGRSRRHPLNDLLLEHVVTVPDAEGVFVIDVAIDSPERVIALWLSADGDDTDSTFTVRVERIAIRPALQSSGHENQ
jgi:hypothetical protein